MPFKVGQEYRENPLSWQPGGFTVLVKYNNGQVREYDKVKNPWGFMKTTNDNPDVRSCWIKK